MAALGGKRTLTQAALVIVPTRNSTPKAFHMSTPGGPNLRHGMMRWLPYTLGLAAFITVDLALRALLHR